jgi:hypothetical protein
MSGLGSLFSSHADADSNDALKYSAPKEPKRRATAKASANSAAQPAATTAAVVAAAPIAPMAPIAAPAAKSPSPSKILVAVTVRLFHATPEGGGYGGYVAVEGGAALGCVVMGAGTSFQILVYNAQVCLTGPV